MSYWNGQPVPVRRVRLKLVTPTDAHPQYWAADLDGQERLTILESAP